MAIYKYGQWRIDADKADYKKYFRQMERVYFGIYGDGLHSYDLGQFDKYELTTKEGVKNTIQDMVKDHKKLIRQIEKQGVKLDYCAIPELSPGKGLIHLHGIMRNNTFTGGSPINQEQLSELWEKIHGAKIVWISKPYSFKNSVEYMVKHTVKEYPASSKMGLRALTSKHWLPVNCELVKKIITKSTIYRLTNSPDADSKALWERASENMMQWVKGKNTRPMRMFENEPFYIKGKEVVLLSGEVYGIIDYALHTGILKNI